MTAMLMQVAEFIRSKKFSGFSHKMEQKLPSLRSIPNACINTVRKLKNTTICFAGQCGRMGPISQYTQYSEVLLNRRHFRWGDFVWFRRLSSVWKCDWLKQALVLFFQQSDCSHFPLLLNRSEESYLLFYLFRYEADRSVSSS